MNPAWLVCALMLVLDAGVISVMLDVGSSPGALVTLASAHAAICVLFSLALFRLLPPPYCQAATASCVFFFVTLFFIPVFGMLGLLAGIVPAFRHQRPAPDLLAWAQLPAPGLPAQPTAPRWLGGLSRACELAGPLQHSADPKVRSAALMATLSLEDPYAAPLLRLALKDPEDDVRLLAYTLLNRKEKAIEARIHERSEQLRHAAPERAFLLHKALGHDYWALAHLGDQQGSTHLLLCERAHEQIQAALALHQQDGGLQFLFGQILLLQMEFDKAGAAFEKAGESGIDPRKIKPFLAEIAFLRRHYAEIRGHLSLPTDAANRLRLSKISNYWEKVIHDAV